MPDSAIAGKKILIVEDEAPLRNALVDALTHEGLAVSEAVDGKAGLDLALSTKPDLILLDMNMPVMDGMTMLRLLREDQSYGATAAVIVLTNLGMFSDQEITKTVNTTEPLFYLVKSNWSIDAVVKKVHMVLTRPVTVTVTED